MTMKQEHETINAQAFRVSELTENKPIRARQLYPDVVTANLAQARLERKTGRTHHVLTEALYWRSW